MSTLPAVHSEFAQAMLRALRLRPHRLSPKFLYDEAGSALFARICELPQYHVTRTELAILWAHREDIAHRIGPHADLLEFGAGSSRKLRVLLTCLRSPVRYSPVDIASTHLQHDAQRLQADFPELTVNPIQADILTPFGWPLPPSGRIASDSRHRVGFFFGSSLGNFDEEETHTFLLLARQLLAGGALLIGVDLIKDPAVLHAAYNDDAGVTAAFNLNVLARANRELGANFVLDRFWHHACYRPCGACVEMHLVSKTPQLVRVCGQTFTFDEGETLHTETSRKFTLSRLHQQAREAGWCVGPYWTDPQGSFALQWLQGSGPMP